MREDTISQRVFIYDQTVSTDDLLYDFSLVQGDSLHSNYAGLGSILTIDSVGITTLLNGVIRKIFYLNNGENYIESIGGSKGLFSPMVMLIEGCSVPKCITFDTTHVWGYECFPIITMGIAQHEFDGAIELFPNPASNLIQIKQNANLIVVFSIFDLTGRMIMTQKLNNNVETINISGLTNGTYIYKLDTGSSGTKNGKLIVIK